MHVFFVEYGDWVVMHHGVRGWEARITRHEWSELLRFRQFRPACTEHALWLQMGALVRPFQDSIATHGGIVEGTDAHLADVYRRWYWQSEVDAERDYQWLGRSIVKMPTDLFLYQELITRSQIRTVLELGSGHGGALWFFGSILGTAQTGGMVVGVDIHLDATSLPKATHSVTLHTVNGDVRDASTIEQVRALCPEGFGLIVIDAPPDPTEKVTVAKLWSRVLQQNGYIVLEDVGQSAPGLDQSSEILDSFLMTEHQFAVVPDSPRHPLLKSSGVVVQRL